MSDDDQKIPAAEVLGMRMGGHLLADHLLQRAMLCHAQQENKQLREKLSRQERKDLYDRVISRYNRAHGQNPKITLKDVCAEMGVSYAAIQKHRSRTRMRKSQK